MEINQSVRDLDYYPFVNGVVISVNPIVVKFNDGWSIMYTEKQVSQFLTVVKTVVKTVE